MLARATSLWCPPTTKRRFTNSIGCKRTSITRTRKPVAKSAIYTFPTCSSRWLNQFTKLYFPQTRKHALIVDVRGSGGGFVSPLVIERLRRALVMMGIARNGMPQTDPPQTFTGPMVTLINEFSASDG